MVQVFETERYSAKMILQGLSVERLYFQGGRSERTSVCYAGWCLLCSTQRLS